MDLGEVNMASGDSLVDFVTWAVENYPADKYALILSDHGMGWPGELGVPPHLASSSPVMGDTIDLYLGTSSAVTTSDASSRFTAPLASPAS